MFCDLVDSTKLASHLDPEDWRDVVRAYQSACTEVIQRYDGHIAQLLGDGLLVYFGYPHAHEDDAQRAVRTGLGILAAMGDLNTRLQQAKDIQLALRIGIHTGLVVVGEMGGQGRQELLALGGVPNVCSRIEGLAVPNTIAMSEATYRLVQGYFECQELGAQALRGVPEPMRVYHVLRESGATSRLDVAQPRGLTPLVGRESEVTLLLERWEQVKVGHGHVVLLTGDAGIGKSRLVQMLKDHVANEPHVRWECRSAEYAQNTALFPLVELFQRLLRFEAHETPDEKVGKLEHALSQYRLPLEDTVPLLAPVLSLPLPEKRYPLLHMSPQRQRQKTLETIVAILLELTEHQPGLFIVEDLHWTDPTTLELLNLVIDQTPTASLLVLLTCRPHFHPAWHHRSYLTEMTLNHLSHTQVAQIVTGMTEGKTFPAEVLHQIIDKTDGVPLFVEEMTKAILEAGQLKAIDGHYELTGSLSTFAIPATLQDSLMSRLDRLMTGKVIAQLGAAIGRQFSYALLQMVTQLNERTLHEELHRLVEAELLYQRGVPPQAMYTFKHALIQDAAYASLLKSTRQQYHQRIAQVLETRFPELTDTQPELVAHHYTEAGLSAQAVRYWLMAGQCSAQRSAHHEAIGHLTKGVEVLQNLPDTPERTHQELLLHVTLGVSLVTVHGYAVPEVERVYTRARVLCQQVEGTPQLFPVLRGLVMFYLGGGQMQKAQDLAEWLLRQAERQPEVASRMLGQYLLGLVLFFRGVLGAAVHHFTRAIATYDRQQHRHLAHRYGIDIGVMAQGHRACALWLLGYPDQALAQSQEGLTLAQEVAHPFSLAGAQLLLAWLHQFRQEAQSTHDRAANSTTLAIQQGFALYVAWCTTMQGWALTRQEQRATGLVTMREGIKAATAIGAVVWSPYFRALLAEAYGTAGQAEEGLHVLTEAQALVTRTGEGFYEAELYRLAGVLHLTSTATAQAEAEGNITHALTIARRQEAKSLELRAATSLARLWQQQGKRGEAYELLAPVYGWFTEGFDTADLQEANALLDALA
jgi:predicted ATPase/class 3 adenylate cyclase